VAVDLAGNLRGARGVDVADPDLGALGGEPSGDRGADTTGSAGHQSLSSLQPHAPSSIDWPTRGRAPHHPDRRRHRCARRRPRLRWAKAGAPIVLGSRSAERAEEAAVKLREKVPGAQIDGALNEDAPSRARSSSSPSPSAPIGEPQQPARSAGAGTDLVDCTVPLAAAVSGKATRSLASGRARRLSRHRRWCPTASPWSPPCTRRRADARRSRSRARRGLLVCGDARRTRREWRV